MSTLHIVSSSALETNALQSALKVASPGDAILLIENGVYAAVNASEMIQLMDCAARGLKVFVLGEDVDARALPALPTDINKASYTDFVDLVCQYHNSVSWN